MITANEVLALGSAVAGAPAAAQRFRHAVVDSRRAARGDLFVALRGESLDGHDFVADAAARGATGAIVQRPVEPAIVQFVVRDPLATLQQLAMRRRERCTNLKVAGITGSVGKTTTKELAAAVLAIRYPLLKSEGNLNSEIGLPLVLLELNRRHRRAVLEMAMWGPGEIRLLCEMAKPQIGVVTNVGPSHMERLGSMQAIADAKAELVESLPPDGVAVLAADDPRVAAMAGRTPARVLTYGVRAAATVRGTDIESRGLAGVSFTLEHDQTRARVRLRQPGRAMVADALAAAAVGIADGLAPGDIAAALSGAEIATRVRVVRARGGAMIIDDTYNASPASMCAALDLLSETAGRKIAVLGDMRELGAAEDEGHRAVGRRAAEVADVIYAVGELGAIIGMAAREAGHRDVRIAGDKEQAANVLKKETRAGDAVLLKASRALALETLAEELAEES